MWHISAIYVITFLVTNTDIISSAVITRWIAGRQHLFIYSSIYLLIYSLIDWLTDWFMDWLIDWLIDWPVHSLIRLATHNSADHEILSLTIPWTGLHLTCL